MIVRFLLVFYSLRPRIYYDCVSIKNATKMPIVFQNLIFSIEFSETVFTWLGFMSSQNVQLYLIIFLQNSQIST